MKIGNHLLLGPESACLRPVTQHAPGAGSTTGFHCQISLYQFGRVISCKTGVASPDGWRFSLTWDLLHLASVPNGRVYRRGAKPGEYEKATAACVGSSINNGAPAFWRAAVLLLGAADLRPHSRNEFFYG